MAQISVLPVWKKGASAEERFQEFALYARQYPEKFKRFALVYEEHTPSGNVVYKTFSFADGGEGLPFFDTMALFEIGKIQAWEASKV